MNKSTAIILLGLVGAGAQAQTNVVIYGIVDAGIVGERGGSGGAITKLTSGAASASRIGFRGIEDLGGGVSAFFNLETGTRIDTGELDAANTIFNRQAFVGLRSQRLGAVALGRQFTPYHKALVGVSDPFGNGLAGSAKNLFPDSGANVRTSNTITYVSPSVKGFDAELAYSVGEQGDSAAGRQFGGAVGYAAGPLAVRLAYNSKNTDVLATGVDHDLGRNTLLAANYNLGWVRLYAAYEVDKGFNSAPLANANNPYGGVRPTASVDGREALLGLAAPLGKGVLMLSVQGKDDRTGFDQDATSWGIGYQYALSKRTALYTAYAHVRNRNGAGYTVQNNSESGSGDTGYNLGVRHTF